MKMRTFREVYEEIGVSRTTLQGWVNDILEKPTTQDTGGWFFDDDDLKKIWKIRFLKQLKYDNKTIKAMLNDPDFDRSKSLDEKILSLTRQKEELETLLSVTHVMQETGISPEAIRFEYNDLNDTKCTDIYSKLMHMLEAASNVMKNEDKNADYIEDEKADSIEEYFVKEELFIRFDALDKIMYLRRQGADAAAKEVQEQVALFPEATAFSLWFSPGGEIAADIDEDYGKGASLYFYDALRYYKNLNGNDKWVAIFKNIIELGMKKYTADSEEVQAEVEKIYLFFRVLSEKRKIALLRTVSKVFGSKTYINIIDNGAQLGVSWFISKAILIYCDKLENIL